jgi:hypothetical protein
MYAKRARLQALSLGTGLVLSLVMGLASVSFGQPRAWGAARLLDDAIGLC